MKFERVEVECKSFRLCSCKLFALDATGKRVNLISDGLSTLLSSYKLCEFESFYSSYGIISKGYLQSNTLKLELEITYSPAVELELIEYELYNFEKLSSGDKGINIANLENLNFSFSNDLQMSQHEEKHNDTADEQSRYEDAHFVASRMGHALSTTLKQDLTSLYEDRLFSDTKLRTDTETFPAHRCVLSARSPVFKKMFTTDMKEKAGECINVPDISSDTVRRMLQFLYTDCTGDLEMQSAKDLYIASDKYDIVSLKERCSSFIKKNLCPSNVCEVLVLADMHQDKDLESTAQEYVLTNDEEVFYSDEWKLFMKNYSCLAAQVMYLKCTKK
ncbi:TD and POZ domain-containing protein 3 [Araneus ventricosus]|uniref:TD and POZ domain-containing protein 3 n=1 Tax=Araneus ventricosus TaxID=182803 RepID=A0A4Y2QET7_ARAVE|nr:TD and POZ domain-containing protein 3 [Araneus ventricosus]